MIDSSFYDKLKEVEYISFKEIIESLGGRMINETKFELPCLNEKTPSCFIYYKNGKEYFKCFGRNIGLMSIFWTQKVKLFYAALLANNSH